MLLLISDAKRLNFKKILGPLEFTIPEYLVYSEKIIKILQKLSVEEISGLMNINRSLSEINYERFFNWTSTHTYQNAGPSIFVFNGDVFTGLSARTLDNTELEYNQQHLRILSGLYGLLKPMDLIKPYRLDMGIKLKVGNSKDLYSFWGKKINSEINNYLKANNCKTIINLASDEYFKVLDLKKVKAEIINPVFIETKNNINKVIVVYTKRARGLMARFIIKNQIENPEHIKAFDSEGYTYSPDLSYSNNWVFMR